MMIEDDVVMVINLIFILGVDEDVSELTVDAVVTILGPKLCYQIHDTQEFDHVTYL